jgi:AIPR protein/abortive infection phage resistance-like protein
MSDEIKLLDFHLQLESEITDLARSGNGNLTGNFREAAFTELIAADLEESGVLESPEICDFEGGIGAGSMKVNGYSVPEEDSRLDLLVTIYKGPSDQPASVNAAEVETAFNKLGRFFSNALDGLYRELDPALDQYNMAQYIYDLGQQIDRVNLLLVTNARLSIRREKRRKAEITGMSATYEIWDLERLRRLRESGASYEALDVDLRTQPGGGLPAVRLDTGDNGFRTWVTVFPGALLAELYGEYGTRLLELNVRSYLQARGKVNQGILETLRRDPEDFMAYNNGITVVAENVVTEKTSNGHSILHLQGMQIVNGGQTTASIHRAAKDYGADLSRVYVQGKVTVVAPSRFQDVVPLISQYSNTQNKVSTSDLSANHVFHVGMQRVSLREWSPDQQTQWFYERARGSYQTAKAREGTTPAKKREFDKRYPASQRFTKEDLAKFENAWQGLPHIVSRGAQKNFVNFMQRIEKLPDGWEPEVIAYRRFVAKGIIFRAVQKIVRSIDSISAYQINVTAYTFSLLAEKTARRIDLDRIWREQQISSPLAATITSWAPVIFQNLPLPAQRSGKHIGESFKSQATWDYIRGLDLKLSTALEQELIPVHEGQPLDSVPGTVSGGVDLQDQNNIARCRELSESQWLKIATWGQKSGTLVSWQKGIARTLAGYAAEDWQRLPSIKQARQGVKMIDQARSHGVFDDE